MLRTFICYVLCNWSISAFCKNCNFCNVIYPIWKYTHKVFPPNPPHAGAVRRVVGRGHGGAGAGGNALQIYFHTGYKVLDNHFLLIYIYICIYLYSLNKTCEMTYYYYLLNRVYNETGGLGFGCKEISRFVYGSGPVSLWLRICGGSFRVRRKGCSRAAWILAGIVS